jgi:ribosomal protein S18 acetylase RimI-like enzyme
MQLKFEKVDINRFDELDIFHNDTFVIYKSNRIRLIQENKCDVFVASLDDEYIGEITVKYVNGVLEDETIPNVRVYLEAFRICYEHQGLGIGQKFLKYVLEYLESLGYTEFTIGVEESNKAAFNIYKKFGFTERINIGRNSYTEEMYGLYLRRTK